MELIANVIISFLELMEAEGNVFKKNSEELIKDSLYKFFGALMLFLSSLLFLYIFYIWLNERYGIYVALIAIASVMLLLGITMLFKLPKGNKTSKPLSTTNDNVKNEKRSEKNV